MFLIGLIFVSSQLVGESHGDWRVRPSSRFSQSFSKPRDSLSWESELAIRVLNKNEVRAFSNFERRKFSGGRKLNDMQIGAGSLLFLHPRFYLDLAGAYTLQVDFLPRHEIKAEPHFTWSSFDFSLGSRWRSYSKVKTFSLKSAISWELSEFFRLASFLDTSLKPERTLSGGMSANFTWAQALETRLSLAGGRSDEGDGIFDDFTEIRLSFLFPILSELRLGLDGGFRASELRDELSYGATLLGRF